MVDTKILLFCLAWLKDAAGAALKRRLQFWLSAPASKKIGSDSGAALKVAAPTPQHCFKLTVVDIGLKDYFGSGTSFQIISVPRAPALQHWLSLWMVNLYVFNLTVHLSPLIYPP